MGWVSSPQTRRFFLLVEPEPQGVFLFPATREGYFSRWTGSITAALPPPRMRGGCSRIDERREIVKRYPCAAVLRMTFDGAEVLDWSGMQ